MSTRNFTRTSLIVHLFAMMFFGISFGLLAYEHLERFLAFAIWGSLLLGMSCLVCSLFLDER